MDSVTQLQNYLSSITSFMTHSMQFATYDSQSVTLQHLAESLAAEREEAEKNRMALTAAAGGAAQPGMQSIKEEGSPAAASADGAPAIVIPDILAPMHSGLQPSVEVAMADRANQLFKRVLEADVLLQALPDQLDGEAAHRRQMEQIAFLEQCNEEAGRELAQAQEEAKLWQKRVSYILQQAAACQLRSSVEPADLTATAAQAARAAAELEERKTQ